MKLSFDYDSSGRGNTQTAEYRGLVIRAEQDTDAENPFTAWDCEPPTLVYSGRRDGLTDYSDDTLDAPLKALSDGKISRHWRAICRALSLAELEHDSDAKENLKGYGGTLAAHRRDIFDDVLSDMAHGNGDDYLEALAALWRLAGCVAVTWTSRGYSQGDYASGLSVATPEWAKLIGNHNARDHKAQCEYAGKLYGFWAWGDVYGFTVEDSDGETIEAAESVWGFYGDDFEESGLSEAARSAVDSLLESRRVEKQTRLAELIKNRVPLALRPAILAQAEAF